MKNLAKTLFAAALAAVVITSSVVPTFAAEPVVKEVGPHSALRFNRIWVSGNVKILLTQGDKQSVVGTETFDPSKTSVMSNGQTLYIKSTGSEQVILNITVKDLQRVVASGHSVVETSNNFDVENLQLFLNQSARARIKTTARSLYTVVNDNAVLKLSGTADESTMVASNMKHLKLGDFSTLRSQSYASEAIMKADRTAMTISK
jgi:tartrate dehydratase beta subunit/fumarate hydratase class I family protein